MESFTLYILKSAVWLTGFSLVYFLFLRNERFFRIKRGYLVTGILASFLLPLISIHYSAELPAPQLSPPVGIADANNIAMPAGGSIAEGIIFSYKHVLFSIYILGIIILGVRIIKQIKILSEIIRKNDPSLRGIARIITIQGIKSPFSFFNYVFISPSVEPCDAEHILNHEEVHIRQKHWFDLLLAEIIRLLQWANPFAWMYAGFVRQNHEYLADEAALQLTPDPSRYRAVLLNQMLSVPVIPLSNSFSYSNGRKRFDMMKRIISSPYRKLRILFVLPMAALIFYAFATPEYKYTSPQTDGTVKGKVLNEENKPMFGVTITVSDVSSGVITDQNGKFAITGIPEGSALVFTFPGFKSIRLNADFSQEMIVNMTKDQDVIPPDLKIVPPPAASSSQSPAQPLWVVDGVIRDSKEWIDPSTISTISVLKGESATSVFGEKGLNGVVVVTRKTSAKDTKNLIRSEDGDVPLFIVDGEIIDEIEDINPDMIKSISVLKGSREVEKYGERARNGVVEITLRKEVLPGIPKQEINQAKAKGIVLKADGTPLSGVSIITTGTLGNSVSTVSDKDGRFEISVNNPVEASFLVSCPGYKRQIIKPAFDFEMTIKMESDPSFRAPLQNRNLLVVVDGVISDKSYEVVSKELGYDLGIVKNLTGREATEKYGDKGQNGILEITTRRKALAMGLKPPFRRMKPEDYPTFMDNGASLFDNWVISQVKYPVEAVSKNAFGRVYVNFTVQLDGTISDIKVVNSPNSALSEEVLRVVKSSPKWDPPENPDVDEAYKYDIAVKFTLPNNISDGKAYVVAEKMPLFPGGDAELLNFIRLNTNYPDSAKTKNIQGKVIVRFIVNTEGKVEDAMILKGVHPLLDKESLRIINLLPAFSPGYQGGRPVNVYYMAPITFTLK